jgi:hypothetical protein
MRETLVAALIVGSFAVAGCAGKGEMRYLDLNITPSAGKLAEPGSAKIVVLPLEDRRSEKGRLGVRTHLWGGETPFNVTGERPGDVVARALVDQLKSRGWLERAWDARLGTIGTTPDADIVITGLVQEFSIHAKSRVFSTVIDTKSKLVFQAKNQSDGSTTTRTVEGVRSRTVFWFNEEDVQELLTDTMKDGIERFITDTTIEQKALRPVR